MDLLGLGVSTPIGRLRPPTATMSPLEREVMAAINLASTHSRPALDDQGLLDLLRFARITDEGGGELPCLQRREFPRIRRGQLNLDSEIGLHPVKPKAGYDGVADQIIDVLCNRRFRRTSLTLIERHIPLWKGMVQQAVNAGKPIELTISALAGKTPSPLGTGLPIDHVDLGELLVMAQFRDLIHSIGQVYAPGARVIILSDALINVGARTPEGSERQLRQYVANCKALRDVMGLSGSLAIVDLGVIAALDPRWEEVKTIVTDRLSAMSRGNAEVQQRLHCLCRSMAPLIAVAPDTDFETMQCVVEQPFASWPDFVRHRTEGSALTFAATTAAMYALAVTTRAFPGAIRLTLIPKDAPQLPYYLISDRSTVMPYNGCPVVSERRLATTQGGLRAATTIVHRGRMMTMDEPIEAVTLGESEHPFYYLHRNG